MEGRVERAILDLKFIARRLANPTGDGVTMHGTPGEGLQHQKIECTLQQVEFGRHGRPVEEVRPLNISGEMTF